MISFTVQGVAGESLGHDATAPDLWVTGSGATTQLHVQSLSGARVGTFSLSGDDLTLISDRAAGAGTTELRLNGRSYVLRADQLARLDEGEAATVLSTSGGFAGDALELTQVETGGTMRLIAAAAGVEGVFSLALSGGRWVETSHRVDTSGIYADDVAALATYESGGRDFVVTADAAGDGITVFEVDAQGRLAARGSVGAQDGTSIANPSALALLEMHGRDLLIVAEHRGNALSVLELGANGSATLLSETTADGGRPLARVDVVEVAHVDGTPIVVAGGGDDGLVALAMMPDGALVELARIYDTTETAMQNVNGLQLHVDGGTLHVFATSAAERGVTHLTLDLTVQLRLGTGGGDRLPGGTGADLLWDGAGRDTLTGGAGADLFVLTTDGTADTVSDFELGVDRLDLSAWDRLHSVDQLTIVSTADGATVSYRDETLTLRTRDGSPLTEADFHTHDVTGLFRDQRQREDVPDDAGDVVVQAAPATEGRDVFEGTDAHERYHGRGGNDWIMGLGGRDHLLGGAGDDVIDGGADRDTLDGGAGRDRLAGQDGDDRLWGGDGHDTLFGGAGGDLLQGGADRDNLDGGAGHDSLYGDSGVDVLSGGEGNDLLDGGADDDRLAGRAGNDVLLGGTGNDRAWGHEGRDRLDGGSGADVLYGGADIDTLIGGTGRDRLYGEDGRDTLSGGDDHDLLDGGRDDDRLDGGAGNDRLIGRDGRDLLFGRTGNDSLYGGDDRDSLYGEAGHDRLEGGDGNDRIWGGAGDDYLRGQGGVNVLYGGDGDDTILALDGTVDVLLGDAGDDELWGGAGDERFNGGAGDDRIVARPGDDLLYGRSGNDVLHGGRGDDTLHGGSGEDTLVGARGNDRLYGGSGNDWLWGDVEDEFFWGETGNDRVVARAGDDFIRGDAGDDVLIAGDGADRVYGGSGADKLYGNGGDDLLRGGLHDDTIQGGAGADEIHGEQGADRILAQAGDDVVEGGSGDDLILGGDGDDTIAGGFGHDVMHGQAGADNFVFAERVIGHDRIEDYDTGEDALALSVALVGGATSGRAVVQRYGSVEQGNVVLDFDGRGTITLVGETNLQAVAADISIL